MWTRITVVPVAEREAQKRTWLIRGAWVAIQTQPIGATHAECLIREIAHSLHTQLETCLNYRYLVELIVNLAK